jgi:hypothetical protein
MYKFALLLVPMYFLWKLARGLYLMRKKRSAMASVAVGQVWVGKFGGPAERPRLKVVDRQGPWIAYVCVNPRASRRPDGLCNMHVGFLTDNYTLDSTP